MVTNTKEIALEQEIERHLTGLSTEEVKALGDNAIPLEQNNGFVRGIPQNFNKLYALDEHFFWEFLESTQADKLENIKKYNPQYKEKIIGRFHKIAQQKGILHLLKNGLDVDSENFILFYFNCNSKYEKNNGIRKLFAQNIFSITRQLQYSRAKPGQEIDFVIFVNGIPIITAELKNALTGQTARYNGIQQYKKDRDPNETLFNFARCLVHFAVDTDEVYMTTKLVGDKTFFLPFNKGNNHGQGNPVNNNGFKTSYLWEDIFRKENLSLIIDKFMRLSDGKKLKDKTLFFPRYHQFDVVRKLIHSCEENGVGGRYLIQHSAGSGKSNSITWLAYSLIKTYAKSEVLKGRDSDKPLFDSVIVVVDRRLLNKQLKDNILLFNEVKGIVAQAESSQDLKYYLESGKKIITTTIQKFPFIVDGIGDLADHNFAVIIDEAHSGQTGSAHDNMNRAMGSNNSNDDDEDTLDAQDLIVKTMEGRKMKGNASYFAFTATPKNSTLEKFGTQQADGSFLPFHLYSMKQAIEEGFILDVLRNYTTYNNYYELQKIVNENPKFNENKAQKALKAFVEKNKRTIAIKAEEILKHFIENVVQSKRLKGKGKGMVITQSIQSAINYYNGLQIALAKYGNPFKIAIAFSGEKEVDGISYSEAQMNGFPEKDTKDKFDEDEYRLLVVANKYLTGFDQPKLCAMYVDKKLSGVLAVQALSRLNRSANNLGKRTEDLFVLDFFNEVEDIQASFQPYYTKTSLSKATEANMLHEIKTNLDDVGIYTWEQVTHFTESFFSNVDIGTLNALLDAVVAEFDEEDDEVKIKFKVQAKQFVKVYSQIAAIIPFENKNWEIFYWFLKWLIPKLNVVDPEDDGLNELLESVDLSTYALSRSALNERIKLETTEYKLDPQNPNPRSGASGTEEPEVTLTTIIDTFNMRWFQGWESTPETFRVRIESLISDVTSHPSYEKNVVNNPNEETRHLAFESIIKEVVLKRRKEEREFYKHYRDDAFHTAFVEMMKAATYGSYVPSTNNNSQSAP